ncbi:MAG: hypothetical protein E7404_03970 [Ruminococcaceae bacterium]|nr:hypothetical protein [Oscillospiraceae bacterium]
MEITKIILGATHYDDAINIKHTLLKNKNTLYIRKTPFETCILPASISEEKISKFFMDITQNFFVLLIIKESSLYEDILYAVKILSACKNTFILFFDDTDTLNENFSLFLSEKLKTYTCFYKHNKNRLSQAIKKDIYSFMKNGEESSFLPIYPDEFKNILSNLSDALFENNKYLKNLAPHILTSSKVDITKLSNFLNIDILDNIKILKALCVAMEFMESCNIKKTEIEKSIKSANEKFALDIVKNSCFYKTKEKRFSHILKNLKCPSFIEKNSN